METKERGLANLALPLAQCGPHEQRFSAANGERNSIPTIVLKFHARNFIRGGGRRGRLGRPEPAARTLPVLARADERRTDISPVLNRANSAIEPPWQFLASFGSHRFGSRFRRLGRPSRAGRHEDRRCISDYHGFGSVAWKGCLFGATTSARDRFLISNGIRDVRSAIACFSHFSSKAGVLHTRLHPRHNHVPIKIFPA